MKDEILIKILETIIGRLFNIENCGGDWNPECADIPSDSCAGCCRGKELLANLQLMEEAK